MLAVVVVSIVVSVVVVVALGRRNCGRILWYKGVGSAQVMSDLDEFEGCCTGVVVEQE